MEMVDVCAKRDGFRSTRTRTLTMRRRLSWWVKMMNLHFKTRKSVSKARELCIKNEEFCIKNEGLCIKNEEFCKLDDPDATGAAVYLPTLGNMHTWQNPDFPPDFGSKLCIHIPRGRYYYNRGNAALQQGMVAECIVDLRKVGFYALFYAVFVLLSCCFCAVFVLFLCCFCAVLYAKMVNLIRKAMILQPGFAQAEGE